MYMARANAQFKINTRVEHLFVSDGFSVVQCRLGPALELYFGEQFLWRGTNVLDNRQLAMLPQSERREVKPYMDINLNITTKQTDEQSIDLIWYGMEISVRCKIICLTPMRVLSDFLNEIKLSMTIWNWSLLHLSTGLSTRNITLTL